MYFTSGNHMYYEHLMKQVPNFDKRPREIKGADCLSCEGFNKKNGKCRFCECQYEQTASGHRSGVYSMKGKEKA